MSFSLLLHHLTLHVQVVHDDMFFNCYLSYIHTKITKLVTSQDIIKKAVTLFFFLHASTDLQYISVLWLHIVS